MTPASIISASLTRATCPNLTKVIETDLYGVGHMSRATIAHLRASQGCIVNVSSVSGLGGDWNHSFYCAAKGAVRNFTRALAMDEAKAGVRVNAVNPSLTYTALTAGMKEQPGYCQTNQNPVR